ncbi:MAG: ShlB/FhaC/HecB family hemolysin secretion/activation protein [Nostoc sp. NMS1]|uniref:ShlB/FhaC/HecB family hemolysin secretion/activation protein n=1 Tax=unclassified Nostoc TaxID=2593658 RepID=UPI0025D06C53|nr:MULTISPECIES: ShlB/FhaC/HecB family hemolysin secretion/activation protein [unclassified Nostoc]MBN3911433.1 ShlB/FhaC/HecB family hemolysin secretion/activation protein [Nostoc sp. NMS1]MBN3994760.1 ShlB/FhaC/HecB family hemolysin secretion/activation protein [Nostoc sp. NMS2]
MRKETETGIKPKTTTQKSIVCFSHQLNTWQSLATTRWNKHSFSFQCGLLILPAVWIITANGLRATANNFTPDSAANSSQPKLQIVQETEPNPQSLPPQPETPQRIRVRKIQVVDSTVFNENDFNRVVKPFEERDLTLEEIRQAADAVTQLYLNKGYINSRAVPDIQQPSTANGVVVIRVIEGRLTEIDIEGTRRLNPSYIRSRIQLGASTPLNTGKLEEQLKLLRLDPLFTNVEARLRPTGKVGQSILIVRVEEAKSLIGSLGVDNYSPPSIGAERLGVELRDRNLTGMGDELAGSYYHTFSGGSDAFDFSYQVPVNAMNGKVQIRAAFNRNEITEPPFNAFGIRANQDLYEINYRQPLVRSPRVEFALSLGFTYQDGQTFLFDNLATPFGIGPDANGVSRTSVIKFGQDYIKREPQGAWFLRSQFNFGIDVLDATVNNDPIPDGRFFSWLGQIQRVQQLSADHLLLIQADLQLTPDSLLPSQQFVIGGGQSVRGYRQNIRSGDNGFRVAIEDRFTVQRNESGLSTIQLAPFLDMGAVWNQSNNPNQLPDQTFLVGAGLGFLWNQAMGIDNLFLRLDYGLPFIDLSDRGNNAQDDGFYFSLRYQP